MSNEPIAENVDFSFETARNYWKFAPCATGKVNTAELSLQEEEVFYQEWRESSNRRYDHYWEDQHFVRFFSAMFSAKRILSFGSGMGFNEVLFMRAGADLTCADIVESNLKVIERVCKIENLSNGHFLYMSNSAETSFPGLFDHIFVRGSLMTMPADLQRQALANFERALKPGGLIILNLYTKKFVDDTCGVDDPKIFARASDPSVGDIHCPWSDWHDDAKLLELAGDEFFIPYRQFWNQGCYVWYALARKSDFQGGWETEEFFELDAAMAAKFEAVKRISPSQMQALEAKSEAIADRAVKVTTTTNQFHYALSSAEFTSADFADWPNYLHMEVNLLEGAISVSILDVAEDKMIFARTVDWNGHHQHYFSLRHLRFPARFKVLISNNSVKEPRSSSFIVLAITLGCCVDE